MVKYVKGDLFQKAPSKSILAHACNCQGTWEGGIAVAFKQKFPSTYKIYREHCHDDASNGSNIAGTCLLIPSSDGDVENSATGDGNQVIACLFTSIGYGSRKHKPSEIIQNTRKAIADLKRQLLSPGDHLDEKWRTNNKITIHMPKINAGLFAVPWEKTEAVLDEFEDIDFVVYVID